MTPTTPNAAAVTTASEEDQPSSPPCLDPHNSASDDQIEVQPRSATPSPEPLPLTCTAESSLTSLKPSPKDVINGIAPHVLDERKSRPVRKGSIGSGGGSKRNLRRLQYIQQCQKQLQECQESQRYLKATATTPCHQRAIVESSPLRVLGSYTFEDLQAQVEFVVGYETFICL
ncbi:hypothetical protein L218DRAFT_674410 [Marasmius fiardii PR-910]|nr:hypothetical protein L218DRAFT_674410 [Marasmius fiardii PR-910]